jgi:prolipoprotein diacylglyceryl transferase
MLASLPSPTRSAVFLGPLPLRFYALCIIVGIVVAVWLGMRRWAARGGKPEEVLDVAGWAVVFGIVGGRLYHVVSDPELYFLGRPGTSPVDALKIWDGGLGIWGAIALGTLGAWIGCRRHGLRLPSFADAVVPGVAFAQGIGRIGNWFNNELYGGPTSVPWRLEIHTMDLATGRAGEVIGYFQPTFLYELIWDVALGFALIWADRRFRLGNGRVMALYVMGYTTGRVWIELLRTDDANHILGLRLNVWTSIIVFLLGLAWFVTHRGPREASIYRDGRAPDAGAEPVDTVGDTDAESLDPADPGGEADVTKADGDRETTR